MKTSDLILLDTNVLVYNHQEKSELNDRSRAILKQGFKGLLPLCVCPQVLLEFYATITNPKRVTNPAPSREGIEEIEKYLTSRTIQKVYSNQYILKICLELLKRYEVKRQEVFDLRLVATMLCNNIKRIYTFNQDDFVKYLELEVLQP